MEKLLPIAKKIQALKGKKNNDKQLTGTIVLVMKEMGWSYEDLNKTPISTFFIVIDALNRDAKRQEAEMNKRRR